VSNERRFVFEADYLGLTALASAVGLGPDNTVLGLSVAEVVDFVDEVTADSRMMDILQDWPSLHKLMFDRLHEDNKVEAMKFVLNRANYSKIPVGESLLVTVAETIAKSAQDANNTPERLRFLRDELVVIHDIYTRGLTTSRYTTGFTFGADQKRKQAVAAELSARRVLASFGVKDACPRHQIYSGIVTP
jgi:hypothetical protein